MQTCSTLMEVVCIIAFYEGSTPSFALIVIMIKQGAVLAVIVFSAFHLSGVILPIYGMLLIFFIFSLKKLSF